MFVVSLVKFIANVILKGKVVIFINVVIFLVVVVVDLLGTVVKFMPVADE